MKKTAKKLVLAKETVQKLEAADLGLVDGAASGICVTNGVACYQSAYC